MCGIAGIVGKDAIQYKEVVNLMLESMQHRGPDGKGLYVAPSGFCVLGHRRLSILDLTDAASQPMLSEDRGFAFVYNGELYNFTQLKHELEKSGESFHSSGDTEVLLKLLIHHGEQVLPRLNGMFAFGLWDERKRRLLLARDRFGQKPLYMTKVGNLCLFASEIRALLATGLVPREADPIGVLSFLAYGAVQGPSTIAKGISLLPKASYHVITAEGSNGSNRYWSTPRQKLDYSPDVLRSGFESAVERHLISDAPIGLFLSGGIDSSAITMAAARKSVSRVSSLTVIFPDQPKYSETTHARRIANLAETDHHEIPVLGKDILSSLPAALQAMDQPSVDGINTYIVSLAARQAGLKAVLSGLGGDELFGGYPSFQDIPRALRISELLKPVGTLVQKVVGLGEDFSRINGKILDLIDSTNDLTDTYLARRRLFTSRQVKTLIFNGTKESRAGGISAQRLGALGELLAGRSLPDAICLLEMDLYMGETLLRDSDVMGMAHGVEIRLPFLDADFSSYSLSLGPEARTPYPFPKHLFVKALADILPIKNTDRRKQGFTLPFQSWLVKDLRDEVQDGIESLAGQSGFFRRDSLQRLWDVFCERPSKVGWTRPWSLFVLDRYLKTHRLELACW
jgi:asparagine synthase (glutamine-hydrolysing)